MAAMVTVSAFVSLSRPVDISRAMVRAAGVRCSLSAFSARRQVRRMTGSIVGGPDAPRFAAL
jgi:hypothetical protein